MVAFPSLPTFHGMNADSLCDGFPFATAAAAAAAAPGANAQMRPGGLPAPAAAPVGGAAPFVMARRGDAAEGSSPEAALEEKDEVLGFLTASESSNSSF